MQEKYLTLLRCPYNGKKLHCKNIIKKNEKIKEGILIEPSSGNEYPIVNFIPRFVPEENYARSFGYQWNIHYRTQYDKQSGYSSSQERFENVSKWGNNLSDELILEVGCGAGRFTEHAVNTNAMVISFDYSNAVEANYRSNGQLDNLLIVQADIYNMPFNKLSFDKAFCFGVLQHTPDPKQSFISIVKYLKPNGCIASDVYHKTLIGWLLQTKYYVRPFTKGKDPDKLYKLVKIYVEFMWSLAKIIRKIPKIGHALNWRLLVADHYNILPNADDATLKEWAILDTFDMLSPMYDFPQTIKTFNKWHEEAGLTNIDICKGYNGLEGRGKVK